MFPVRDFFVNRVSFIAREVFLLSDVDFPNLGVHARLCAQASLHSCDYRDRAYLPYSFATYLSDDFHFFVHGDPP